MHFALPPRKSSNPPPYAVRSSRSPLLQRVKLRNWAVIALGLTSIVLLISKIFRDGATETIPPGTPPAVVVTTIDPRYPQSYINTVKDNRDDYAARHGYATFFPNTTDYDLADAPESWSKIPAMRHAMTLYPYSTYFFYLTPLALIMNPSFSLESHIMDQARLESLMLVDYPVVPPDSVIKTFAGIKGDRIDLVLTQDRDALSQGSFIVRRGEWAKYFLDAWFDPLYRSYNFQKAEGHALEHIVQWHGTILAKLALVPIRTMNAYFRDPKDPTGNSDYTHKEGDFVVNFTGCDTDESRDCEKEMAPMIARWRELKDRRG
ncbi:MAG: hypothetical protein M1820_004439 [Bogoriella megaspora]|nr:MAG: hypothetical protein M1820_004439 [Bogoriella megaspora]